MRDQPREKHGFVKELEDMSHEMAQALFTHRRELKQRAGPPWGSQVRDVHEALALTDEYEDPARAEDFGHLSDGALAAAAIQAVRLRQDGVRRGIWAPKAHLQPQAASLQDIIAASPELAALLGAEPVDAGEPGPPAPSDPTAAEPAQLPLPF